MKTARLASYEKQYFYPNGRSLYIWITDESRADIIMNDISYKQAKEIAKTFGIVNLKKQSN